MTEVCQILVFPYKTTDPNDICWKTLGFYRNSICYMWAIFFLNIHNIFWKDLGPLYISVSRWAFWWDLVEQFKHLVKLELLQGCKIFSNSLKSKFFAFVYIFVSFLAKVHQTWIFLYTATDYDESCWKPLVFYWY